MNVWIRQMVEKIKNVKKKNLIILGAVVIVLLIAAIVLVVYNGREKEMTGFTYELKAEDADSLLTTKLADDGYTFAGQEEGARIDDADYFIYHISDGGVELEQGIAVNKVSGEIYGYNFADGTITDYASSMFYNEEQDKVYSWDGTYENKETKTQVTMLPADASTFELTITVDGVEKLFGSAMATGDTAQYEGEDISFAIKMRDGEIQITDVKGKSNFSGTYLQK